VNIGHIRRIGLILWTLSAACSAALALDRADYDPYAVGNRWDYRFVLSVLCSMGEGEASRSGAFASAGKQVCEIVSEKERRSDGIVYLLRETDTTTQDDLGEVPRVTTSESQDLISSKGHLTVAMRDVETGESKWHEYDPPLRELPGDLSPGKEWSIGTSWRDTFTFKDDGKCVGTENVAVAAGEFDDCLKIVAVHGKVNGTFELDAGDKLPIKGGKGVLTYWLAKGVGVVKSEDVEQLIMEKTKDGKTETVTVTLKETMELLPGYKVK